MKPLLILFMQLIYGLGYSATWNGLELDSGFIIHENIDFGKYGLVLQIVNPTQKPILVPSVALYNSSRDVTIINIITGKEVDSFVSGGLSPSGDSREQTRGIVVNPGSRIILVIPLSGIRVFDDPIPGRYRGKHAVFGDIIPEFSLEKNGDVRMIRTRKK